MYANALKRVIDEDDDYAMSYHNDSVDVPMEIKKIDDYDGRIKKYYSSADANKSKNSSHFSGNDHPVASNAEEASDIRDTKSIGTNDNTSFFSSMSAQKKK